MWETMGTLGAVIVGAVAGAGGAYLGQRALAVRTRKNAWADSAASTLADVKMLLTDVNPDVLLDVDSSAQYPVGVSADRRVSTAVRAVRDEDRAANVRLKVAVLASGHPDRLVRVEASKLEARIAWVIEVSGRIVDSYAEGDGPAEDTVREARRAWDNAQHVRYSITDSLHA